jgi:hypothetical protein
LRAAWTVRCDGTFPQAFADGAALTLFLGSRRVLSLGTALTGCGKLVDPGLHIANGEPVQSLTAQARTDVQPNYHFVQDIGGRPVMGLDNIGKPLKLIQNSV